MSHLVIVGGSDAGISAALRARELDPAVEITVILADAFPNYSICGLPFFLSGEVSDWHDLAHRTVEEISQKGIQLLTDHRAHVLDPIDQQITVTDAAGLSHQIPYDRLVIGTGADVFRPSIPGVELPGVFFLRTMGDSFALHRYLETASPRSALIIGGGYIGLEMADALTLRGLSVTVVERGEAVLKTVDPSLGLRVQQELETHGVEAITQVSIDQISQSPSESASLRIAGSNGFEAEADLVLVSVGVRPATALATSAGIRLGIAEAIQVDRQMRTTIPHTFAAGDCVETWHRLLQHSVYLPLGTTAHKQGRIAGANAVGGSEEFAGTLGTQVVKIFELVVARTGLKQDEALAAGLEPFTHEMESWDHKVYYPGARKLVIRLTGDRHTGQLLGAQIVGDYRSEVSKRVDIYATALFHGMSVASLSDLDLSYTPPLSSPWDPVQMAAQAWAQEISSRSPVGIPVEQSSHGSTVYMEKER